MSIPQHADGLYQHADAAFRMGASHERGGTPCQDYALAGSTPYPWGIVSDGCSMSGRTDVGARILALAARGVVLDPALSGVAPQDILDRIRERVVRAARAATVLLDLERACDLDATLGVVAATASGANAFLYGDGVVAALTSRGVETVTVSWAGNMPGYPSYMLDAERAANFVRLSEEAAADAGTAACTIRREVLDAQEDAVEVIEEARTAWEGLQGLLVSWSEPPDVVAVFTDGVASFGDGLSAGQAVAALMDFKGRQGEFAMRRMRRVLGDAFKDGLRPGDDISMAAIAKAILPQTE